jgi:hypothetical protein
LSKQWNGNKKSEHSDARRYGPKYFQNSPLACIIREAAEEWFWGGEIVSRMLAAA